MYRYLKDDCIYTCKEMFPNGEWVTDIGCPTFHTIGCASNGNGNGNEIDVIPVQSFFEYGNEEEIAAQDVDLVPAEKEVM